MHHYQNYAPRLISKFARQSRRPVAYAKQLHHQICLLRLGHSRPGCPTGGPHVASDATLHQRLAQLQSTQLDPRRMLRRIVGCSSQSQKRYFSQYKMWTILITQTQFCTQNLASRLRRYMNSLLRLPEAQSQFYKMKRKSYFQPIICFYNKA